ARSQRGVRRPLRLEGSPSESTVHFQPIPFRNPPPYCVSTGMHGDKLAVNVHGEPPVEVPRSPTYVMKWPQIVPCVLSAPGGAASLMPLQAELFVSQPVM